MWSRITIAGMCALSSCGGQNSKPVPPGSKAAEATYHYFPAKTVLHGTLQKQQRFGPPGFGETPKHDARISIYVLQLDQSIRVQAAAGADAKQTADLDNFSHQRSIQLFFKSKEGTEAPGLIGHAVTVSGALGEAVAPGQYTPVTMDVDTLQAK